MPRGRSARLCQESHKGKFFKVVSKSLLGFRSRNMAGRGRTANIGFAPRTKRGFTCLLRPLRGSRNGHGIGFPIRRRRSRLSSCSRLSPTSWPVPKLGGRRCTGWPWLCTSSS
jgi:hypothetical protein